MDQLKTRSETTIQTLYFNSTTQCEDRPTGILPTQKMMMIVEYRAICIDFYI